MKEIDTENSVVWPSWCYSDKVKCDVLKECSEIEKDFDLKLGRDSNFPSPLEEIKPTSDCNTISGCSKRPATKPASASLSQPTTKIVGGKKMLSERSLLLSGYINSNTIDSAKTNCDTSITPPLAAVPLSAQESGLTITPTTTAAAAAAYLYLEKVKNERMSPCVTAAQLDSLKDAIMESSAAAAVAAAMVNNNNNKSNNNNNSSISISNNNNNSNNTCKNNNNSSSSNCSNSCSTISNNLVSSQIKNQIANNSINNTSDELHSHTLTHSCSQPQQQQHQLHKQSHHFQHHHQQQQQQLSLHMNSNHVKKERLSPGTNGDLQTTLSRSRSTTPSSFRGTSPQNSVHSSPSDSIVPMHNLSTNLLNSIHQAAASSRHGNLNASSPGVTSASSGLPTDFSTRNYSDFMRSLAAKYNNTNPNDNLKRNTLFEATSNNTNAQKKTSSTSAQKTSYANSPSTPLNKEVTITTTSSLPPPAPLTSVAISPGESSIKLTQQNKLAAAVANAAAACSSNVSPYMTSFLSSLPFSPGIFPPLIDMSSTQALITLARAAKENEIHNILSVSAQHPKISATSTSPSPSPSLNMALQQAAQFVSPALIYSAQLQKQQLHQQQQQHQQHHLQQQQQPQVTRQSSPRLANISNSTTSTPTTSKSSRNQGEKINVSPLDLSSQPPAAKRFKAESISSQSSTDGLMHTAITRRASSSTATTSPSPPPLNEKSFNSSANAVPTLAVTPSALVVSSSRTEAPSTAFTPIKIATSTSATPSIAPAVTVRQCQAQSEELNSWTVDDVCAFVGSIDICAEYVKHFRDQCIDGSGLPLLTEDHLVNSLGMKLGPALKLRSVLAKKLGGPCPCVTCVAQVQQVLALQTSGMTATTATDHIIVNNSKNISAVGGNTKISGSCNSHFAKNSLSGNSNMSCGSQNNNINSPANKNENSLETCSTISTNSTTIGVCNNDGNANNTSRPNSTSNTNVDNFSSPPPQPPAATTSSSPATTITSPFHQSSREC